MRQCHFVEVNWASQVITSRIPTPHQRSACAHKRRLCTDEHFLWEAAGVGRRNVHCRGCKQTSFCCMKVGALPTCCAWRACTATLHISQGVLSAGLFSLLCKVWPLCSPYKVSSSQRTLRDRAASFRRNTSTCLLACIRVLRSGRWLRAAPMASSSVSPLAKYKLVCPSPSAGEG